MSVNVVDGDTVREEVAPFAWKEFMAMADRTVEISQGFTPTGQWELVTFFLGLSKPGVFGGPFFFATELVKGATAETMQVQGPPLLSRDKAEALANHVACSTRFGPSPARAFPSTAWLTVPVHAFHDTVRWWGRARITVPQAA